jgi:hypothetical protein
MKIKVAPKSVQAPASLELETATSEALEANEVQTQEVAQSAKFQKLSQSTEPQEIEVIKEFNGLKVGTKLTTSKNVAQVLILKNLVK